MANERQVITTSTICRFYEAIGDFIVVCPAVFFSEQLAERNFSVHHYLYNHRPQNSKWGKWMGVAHFDEVPLVFGQPFTMANEYTDVERDFSARLMDTWVTFARTGYDAIMN